MRPFRDHCLCFMIISSLEMVQATRRLLWTTLGTKSEMASEWLGANLDDEARQF
jgi:hypothetical protein